MELCPHGKIEWCPKCDEDLKISAKAKLTQAQITITRLTEEIARLKLDNETLRKGVSRMSYLEEKNRKLSDMFHKTFAEASGLEAENSLLRRTLAELQNSNPLHHDEDARLYDIIESVLPDISIKSKFTTTKPGDTARAVSQKHEDVLSQGLPWDKYKEEFITVRREDLKAILTQPQTSEGLKAHKLLQTLLEKKS